MTNTSTRREMEAAELLRWRSERTDANRRRPGTAGQQVELAPRTSHAN